jgi:CubicO group peptidase (beta-lactamase class C family)
MKKSMLVAAFLLAMISANSQTWDDTVRAIEKIFERYKPSNPGAQVAISRNGKIIYSKAWGVADLEHNAPLTTTSPTEAGSVSKQFTAAAILLLEQQGKLSLNDDVRKYIPELPEYGNTVTLAHMMRHTSGLKDWGSIAAIAGWPRSTVTYSNDDALLIASRQKTLNNKPGDEYIYSNTNYNLLAVIVARVSGMSFADFTQKNIIQPAGMTHTQWRSNFKKIVPNRAIAYSKAGNDYYTNMPNEYVHGNGGLLTTAEDLIAWTNYYTSGKFGSPSLLKNQTATVPLNAGAVNRYAAGLFIRSYKDKQVFTHDGATAGYRANLVYVEALGLTIAWLSNTSEFDRSPNAAVALEEIFLGKPDPVQTGTVSKTEGVQEPALTDHNEYVGEYYSEEAAVTYYLIMRQGKLMLHLKPTAYLSLTPASKDRFDSPLGLIVFERGKKGITGLKISQARARNVPFTRIK